MGNLRSMVENWQPRLVAHNYTIAFLYVFYFFALFFMSLGMPLLRGGLGSIRWNIILTPIAGFARLDRMPENPSKNFG